jgi:hypothetical protein
MENFRKIALGFTLFFAVLIGIRVYLIHKERVEADAPATAPVTNYKVTDDDLVVPRQIFPSTMKDAKALIGSSVWVSAGGQIEYYPVTGSAIHFAHSGGFLLGADELHVKDFILAPASKSSQVRIPAGNKQVFLVFTKPGNDTEKFAAPIGYVDGSGYTFYLDTLFFYDDPHTLYKHWPKPVWDAITQHQAILGMNERQTMMALGQVQTSDSTEQGNRTVKYYNLGKSLSVTFENDKATSITPTAF